MRLKRNNILANYLSLLGVRYTESFSGQYFNEHPHKRNLFGLSKMLSDYNVENGAIRIEDKQNDIQEIQTPFIAQFGGGFVAVYIEAEFRKHEAWKQKTQIRATPTVLVNGYQLPESYKIEDLRYFTNLDL